MLLPRSYKGLAPANHPFGAANYVIESSRCLVIFRPVIRVVGPRLSTVYMNTYETSFA